MSSALRARTSPNRDKRIEQSGRLVDVHVHAQLLARSGHDEAGTTEAVECCTHLGAVDGIRRKHALGAPAMRRIGVDVGSDHHPDVGGDRLQLASRRDATALDVVVDALEQMQEALRAGIDDAGLAQHRELVRRIGERFAARRQGPREGDAQVSTP